MPRLPIRLRVVAALLAAAAALAAGSGPASAGAACTVSGGDDFSEWSLTVTSRSGISCSGAKAVIRSCAKKRSVPGWRVSVASSKGPKFSKKRGPQRFSTMAAGGSPKCVAAAYGY